MDPFFARNRLSAYIDGLLPPEEAAEVEAAIETDAVLREEHQSMRAAVELLRRHGPVSAPEGFHDKVMAAALAQPARGRLVALFRQIPIEAVALAAAAILVIVVISKPGDPLSDASIAPPPIEIKGGAAAPRIEAAPSLSLPTALPAPTAQSQPMPQDKAAPMKKVVPASPREAYVAAWETAEQAPLPEATKTDDDTPTELFEGLRPEIATPYQYRITLSDADVLYSLQALAQSSGGRLLDSAGDAAVVRALTVEDNYARLQLVVPPGEARAVHDYLKRLGARTAMPESGSPLYGAEYVAFVIEVTYLP